MATLSSLLKRYSLAIFCALTLLLSFAAALLPIAGRAEIVPVLMVFIPALVALALTALTEGGPGVRALLGKLGQWRVSPRWVLAALALGLMMRLAMSLIALGLGWIATLQLRPQPPAQVVLLAILLFVFAIPEELGWRGFALPRLLEHRSPLAAGLIIGGLWGSLHLTLHLPGLMYDGLPLLPTLLQLLGLSVLIT
jgi:membrane protease YdiL (CAAX protease family)